MKAILTLTAVVFLSIVSFAQLTKENIKEILALQGNQAGQSLDEQAEYLYDRYIEKTSYRTEDAITGFGQSILSGISMAAHQSKTAGYTNTGWMPKFMQDWYGVTKKTDEVFGKSLTWQKIWRESDYINDRNGYSDLNRFFGDKWYLTLASHLFAKNVSAAFIRAKMKS
jgi:hypothetical protein